MNLSINTPKSFVCSSLQTLSDQPNKIKSPHEMGMGLTAPTFLIGVAFYIFFHFSLGGLLR